MIAPVSLGREIPQSLLKKDNENIHIYMKLNFSKKTSQDRVKYTSYNEKVKTVLQNMFFIKKQYCWFVKRSNIILCSDAQFCLLIT